MNNRFLKYLAGGMFLLLSACAPPPAEVPELPAEKLQTLPGALVSDDGLVISYPGNVLFANGSVLPLPGGMTLLDPLVALLIEQRDYRAEVTVRSSGHGVEYDRQLAEKRAELLERICRNRGLEESRVQFTAAAGGGPPLEITLQPSSSGGSNR